MRFDGPSHRSGLSTTRLSARHSSIRLPTTGRDDPESGAVADATLSLAAVGPGEFTVDPYPFDADPLTAWLPVRTVGQQAFDDERALREAYYETPVETRTLTLRSPA